MRDSFLFFAQSEKNENYISNRHNVSEKKKNTENIRIVINRFLSHSACFNILTIVVFERKNTNFRM